jgi:hypothetical protein
MTGGVQSPLEGIADSVMGDLFASSVGPQTPLEHLAAFRSAVNWTEPLIVTVLVFQIIMLALTLWALRRGGTAVRISLLSLVAIVVRSAERINSYASSRWQDLATQNYFDQGGVFVLLFLCLPLILDCLIMLVGLLREASGLLVEVKTMEVKQKERSRRQGQGQGQGQGQVQPAQNVGAGGDSKAREAPKVRNRSRRARKED